MLMGVIMSHELTQTEQIAYAAIRSAAENNEPCPTNIELEVLMDYSSTSMGSAIVARLERKGYIRVVERCQRFRRILIIATNQVTARHPGQHATRKHVPRGAGSMAGKLARKARRL